MTVGKETMSDPSGSHSAEETAVHGQPAEPDQAVAAAQVANLAQRNAETVRDAAEEAVAASEHVKQEADTAAERAAEAKNRLQPPDSPAKRVALPALVLAIGVLIAALASAVIIPGLIGKGPDISRGENSSSMYIVATAFPDTMTTYSSGGSPNEYSWRVKGQVINDGKPIGGATVYAILRDYFGNYHVSDVVATVDTGFDIPIRINWWHTQTNGVVSGGPSEIRVVAMHNDEGWLGGWLGSSTLRSSMTIRLEQNGGSRWSEASAAPFLSALIIFATSILVAMIPSATLMLHQARYYLSALLGLFFTIGMIYFISVTLQTLTGSFSRDEVISLGFAHVFYGTYVKDTKEEWVLSLTSPDVLTRRASSDTTVPTLAPESSASAEGDAAPTADPSGESSVLTNSTADVQGSADTDIATSSINRGFGAPLWLLLLSVVGASVYTIKVVLENLAQPGYLDEQQVDAHVAAVLRHQFYILFAPLGAVFVYQLLVAAGSASEPITVALAALASGIALSNVLERAWEAADSAAGRRR